MKEEIPITENRPENGIIEAPYVLYEVSEDLKKLKKLADFPLEYYIRKKRWFRKDMAVTAAHDNFIFVVHTAEYRIVKFDLRQARIERIFTRKYKRQKTGEQEINDPYATGVKPPQYEYYFDIFGLKPFKDRLWVMTSTPRNDETRKLVDVFDKDGIYTDSFYLKFPNEVEERWMGNCVLSEDGFILVPEQGLDGFVSIGKYRIKEKF
jgi:hypothetical protein